MNEEKRNRQEKKEVPQKIQNMIIVICILTIGMCFLAVSFIHAEFRDEEELFYTQSLEETAVTVGSDKISLKEASYYIMVIETQYNATANEYNQKSPLAFWNIRLGKKYFRQMAKETLINACIRDNIYYQEAKKQGMELSEESLSELEEKVMTEMDKMTDYQREVTAYQKEDMMQVLTKIQYAREYVNALMEEGYTQDELDTGGSHFEKLKKEYKIEINDALWKQLSIGAVTIDRSEKS